jgi:hypothetical protein
MDLFLDVPTYTIVSDAGTKWGAESDLVFLSPNN